jgi:hypothetical protein
MTLRCTAVLSSVSRTTSISLRDVVGAHSYRKSQEADNGSDTDANAQGRFHGSHRPILNDLDKNGAQPGQAKYIYGK